MARHLTNLHRLEAEELVNELRRATADETRAYDEWAKTTPGSADANHTDETRRRCALAALDLEDEILRRLAATK